MPTNGNTSLTWALEEFNLQRPLKSCKYRVGMRTSPDRALIQMIRNGLTEKPSLLRVSSLINEFKEAFGGMDFNSQRDFIKSHERKT